jgi:hypothetical protein
VDEDGDFLTDSGSLGVMEIARLHRLVAFIAAFVATSTVAALFAGSALAAPPGPDALAVHVVNVKSTEALDQAEALTGALKKAIRDSAGWSLGDTNQSLEFLALQMQCQEPIDAACESRIADVIKADRFLWCVVEFDAGDKQTVVGTLNFFVRGKGTNKSELRYSANLTDANDDALIKVARNALDAATGGAPQGGLTVSSGGVAGQVYIDDSPMGALPPEGTTFQLPAGEHKVVVKAPGFADAESTVLVKPATTVEVTLSMVEVEEATPLDLRMILGFTALGVGVGTGAVGLWAALEVNGQATDDQYDRFRNAVPNGNNVCDAAKSGVENEDYNAELASTQDVQFANDACDKAGTFEVLQAVMFPLAAVSAGVGIYLLGTSNLFGGDGDDADSVEALRIEPYVGPNGGSIALTYQF